VQKANVLLFRKYSSLSRPRQQHDCISILWGTLAAALLQAAAVLPLDATWQRSMATGRPLWMGRPPCQGLQPARRVHGGRRHRASSAPTGGWATARWRGWQGARVRLRDRRAERALQHPRASPRAPARRERCAPCWRAGQHRHRRDADRGNSTAMPGVTLWRLSWNLHLRTVAETETKSRERIGPNLGQSRRVNSINRTLSKLHYFVRGLNGVAASSRLQETFHTPVIVVTNDGVVDMY